MNISRAQGNFPGFLICVAMMAYALYTQHVLGLAPCNLCIFQRVAVIALGIVFLVAVLHRPGNSGSRIYAFGVFLVAGFGVAVASRHVYIQNLPADEVPACGPGLDYMMDTLPLAQVFEKVFTGSGQCADIDWSFLGMSMPMWVLISLVVVGVAGVWWNWRQFISQRLPN